MNPEQQTFLREYLRTGDKIAAYRLAYPKAKESSVRSAVNRLLRTNPLMAQAVHDQRRQLDREAREEVKAEQKKKYIARDRLRELLADVIEGRELTEKLYKTKDGIERVEVKPTISNKLVAANACIRLEGWAVHTGAKKQQEEEQPPEPVNYEIYVGGLPMSDFMALYDATLEAYFDKEDGTWRGDPANSHVYGRFMALQAKRGARKDAGRQARMTPQLQQEEDAAMRAFGQRPVDEAHYIAHDRLIEHLQDEYIETKDAVILKELKAVQAMCGLRFLHHRHRYEAERAAGWEFHPLNNNLVRKAPSGFPPRREEKNLSSVSAAEEAMETQGVAPMFFPGTSPKRQHPETSGEMARQSPPESMQATLPEPQKPPTAEELAKQGYKPMRQLMSEEWDYYIHNQGSTTHRQLKELEHFIANRNASSGVRQQTEQETGWLYHPGNTSYGKRNPARQLVRTKFKGAPGSAQPQ